MQNGLLFTPDQITDINPLQKEFNNLILQLENFDVKIEKAKKDLEERLVYVLEYLVPMHKKLLFLDVEMIKCIHVYFTEWNVSVSKRELMADYLIDSMDMLFIASGDHENAFRDELKPVYIELTEFLYGKSSKGNDYGFDEEVDEENDNDEKDIDNEEERENALREKLDFMENLCKHAGLKVDLSGINSKMSDEEVSAYLDQIQQKLFSEDPSSTSRKKNKKSKKQLEKELLREQMEELKNKNISSIFKNVAKVLHPDLEQDPVAKIKKEALMKELTSAYEKKDLRAMLRLEMEWVLGEKDKLDKLTDDKLKVFIELLKEQLAGMKESINELSFHPRYSAMYPFAGYGTNLLKWKPAQTLKEFQFRFNSNSATFEKIKNNNRLSRDIVNNLLEDFKNKEDDFPF